MGRPRLCRRGREAASDRLRQADRPVRDETYRPGVARPLREADGEETAYLAETGDVLLAQMGTEDAWKMADWC